jgi:cytochrome b subunit of formate dehydrogenase
MSTRPPTEGASAQPLTSTARLSGVQSRLPFLWLGLAAFVVAATIAFWVLNLGTPDAETDFGTRFTPLFAGLNGLVFAIVGALIASRRTGNAVGQVCLLIGLTSSVNSLAIEYSVYGVLTAPGALPGGLFSAWIANWTWVIYVGLMGAVLVLLFPTGRLLSPRWRWVMGAALVGMAMAATGFALAPGQFTSVPWASNPFGVEELATMLEILESGFFLLAIAIVAAAISMVVRFRKATGIERSQIKWFASAASLLAVVYVGQAFYSLFTGTLGDSPVELRVFQTAIVALFGFVAASVGIAVLRYRLYEIDRIVSRTVSYAVVAAVLASVYASVVVGIQALLPISDHLAVAASTLTAVALFSPLRRRVQAIVDRRFNRAHYDAQQEIDRLTQRLRTEMEIVDLTDELLGVVNKTMQPAGVTVWIKEER